MAGAIFLARTGRNKAEIKTYVEEKYGYNLDRQLDEIRPDYRYAMSCQNSVPEAITAFPEGDGYEDTIRNAISIGGDSDTIAAIAGSIAQGMWEIPAHMRESAAERLDDGLKSVIKRWDLFLNEKRR